MNIKFATILSLAPVSVALAFALASPAKAAPTLAGTCAAGDGDKVTACCQAFVAAHGLPAAMKAHGLTCSKVVICTGKVCKIKKQPKFASIVDEGPANGNNPGGPTTTTTTTTSNSPGGGKIGGLGSIHNSAVTHSLGGGGTTTIK